MFKKTEIKKTNLEELHSPAAHRRRFRLVFLVVLLLFLFLHITGADAKAPEYIQSIVRKLTPPPSPIVQSDKKLPTDLQQAIVTQAKQEIKTEQAAETLATGAVFNSPILTQSSSSSGSLSLENVPILADLADTISETFSTTPADKAKAKIRRIDRLIRQLNPKQTANQLIAVIKKIGQLTEQIATDQNLRTDREILTLQIEQYNRLQLTLQKIEDTLPIESYLKVEDARQKYLVVSATASINAAPNLEAIHNIAVKEIAKIVGSDFSELKAIEVISDFESGIKPEARQKLIGLERQLALDFEKRMLKLPPDVRNRKLQTYTRLSFGNPLRQTESFERMKNFLTDREIILEVDSLKELALQKLENRVFEIKDQSTLNQFLDQSFKRPEDLKILAQMKLDVLASRDEQKKKQFSQLETDSQAKIEETFGQNKNLNDFFASNASVSADLLDVSMVSQLAAILDKSPKVSVEAKTNIRSIKQKTIQGFVNSVQKSGFLTNSKPSYNPVPANADVRLLLPQPQAIALLEAIKNDPNITDKSVIVLAEKSASNLIVDHLTSQVNDLLIFEQAKQFLADNPQVKEILKNNVGQSVLTNLDKKEQVLQKETKKNDQHLFEKVQQITQEIFITPDGVVSSEEKILSSEIQKEIATLKQSLPEKNIPQIETPPNVKLPEVAKLPSNVEQAIITVAKDRIREQEKEVDAKLDLTVQAKGLGVTSPAVLPDSPLYPIIQLKRLLTLVIQTDPIAKAQELLKQDNEKTLEAAKLIEESSSQKNIELAVQTLNSVNEDFNRLKEHSSEVKKLEQTQPERVDELIDQIIENGLARQTVFSAILDKVHGDDFVAVEAVRSEVLKEGIDTLLQLSNNDVPKLTKKLETAVHNETGGQFKDIKAIELLTEISRTQPEPVQEELKTAEASISANLETKLLEIPKEQRVREVLSYAQSESGNPVRQFAAAEVLKDNFKNPETILLAEAIKDEAVANLKERISEIVDANSRQEFVNLVVGDKPQDLKIALEIEIRVAPPAGLAVTEALPAVQKIEEIKAEVEQNIIDAYKDRPADLARAASVSATPDVMDVKVAQELNDLLSRSPEVSPEVVAVAKKIEEKVIETFVADLSKLKSNATVSAQTLNPAPETIAELVDLKSQLPASERAQIDLAINIEVKLIEEHLTTQVTDTTTIQTYIAQVQQDPVIAKTTTQVGGKDFTQAIEQKSQEVALEAQKEQTQLQTTVEQVRQEVFSTNTNTSAAVEQTLAPIVQQKVEEIKASEPAAQIPAVTVEGQAATTVTVSTPAPTSAPAPSPVPSVPAPSAPEVKSPEPIPAALPSTSGL